MDCKIVDGLFEQTAELNCFFVRSKFMFIKEMSIIRNDAGTVQLVLAEFGEVAGLNLKCGYKRHNIEESSVPVERLLVELQPAMSK